MGTPTHPIQIVLREPELRRSRLTAAFRLLLFLPHAVWWALWGVAIVVVAPIQWVWALISGGPTGLHPFYSAYLRYSVHLHAYLSLAANPFPGFLGAAGYPVDVELPQPSRQSRWSIAFRAVLWLPTYVLAATLVGGFGSGGGAPGGGVSSGDGGDSIVTEGSLSGGGVLVLAAVGAWFVILARGRTPAGLRDLSVYCIGYAAQSYGYLALLTGRFPSSAPAIARPAPMPRHPIRVVADDDRRRSRLTAFFRALLFLPHLVWLTLWAVAAALAAVANWLATLALGRSPARLHAFLAAYVRYRLHVIAFVSLTANPFPGFLGRLGTYPVDLEVDDSARQSRWSTGFRAILAIPAALLAGALAGVIFVASAGAWVAAVLTGRVPPGLRELLACCLRYDAQLAAYGLVLTDRYPYSGPTLVTEAVRADSEPVPPPAPAGWEPPVPPRDWSSAPEAV